jgi:tetratricopeptide (TPR) repeat protein/transglutaminase-like putative cysteine protease
MLPRLFLLATLCVPAARDDDPWPVKRGPSREPEPYRYDPKIITRVPKEFLEDSAACIYYFGTSNLVEADGTTETIFHDVTRLNSRKGVEKLGEYRSISFDPAYQTLTLHMARIHKADGKILYVRPEHLKLRDQGTDYQVYDAEKQLIISFPNLQVGDVIEVKWSTRGKCPEFLDHFFTRYTFGDIHYPLVRDEFRVRLPRNKAVKFSTVNGQVETVLHTDGQYRNYLWRVRNRPPLPTDDNLPSKEELRLQLSCSTFGSWEEVGRWKKQVRADCWRCTPEIREVLDKVTKSLSTDVDKARALTYWVRRHIRYLSLPSARHSYTPHDPKEVLANRYGDCKDQAQLLAVMLRELGIPVALVTLGAQDDGQVMPEAPSPWGTHAILMVTIDGRRHWIDTTSTFAAWDFLPPDDRDRVAYVTDDNGIYILRTPPLTCDDNRFEQTTWLNVDVQGMTTGRRMLTYHGAAALAQRDTWTDVAAGERRRLMSATLQDAHAQTRLAKLQVDETKLLDLDQPVEGAVAFTIPGHFTGDPELEGSVADSRVWNRIVGYPLDPDRTVALELGRPFESIHRYVVQLPPAYRIDSLPAFRRITSLWGSFTLRARLDARDPHRLELIFHTRLEKTRVDPARFAEYRAFHEELTKHWRVWLTLKHTRAAEDALALNLELLARPDDKVSALVLARLFHRQGQVERAGQVLRRTGLFHPGDAEVGKLAVDSAANAEEEEAAFRDLIRHHPHDSDYVLGLAAVLVRRGEHAVARELLEPLTQGRSMRVRSTAHFHLARSAAARDLPRLGLRHLRDARLAESESVNTLEAWQLTGELQERLSRTAEAIVAYGNAVKLNPEHRGTRAALIRLLLREKRRQEALEHLRRYTVLVGDDADDLLRAAAFHYQMGRLEDAADLAGRAQKEKFHGDAQRLLGLVAFRRGDFAKAAYHLDRAPRGPEELESLLLSYLTLGQLDRADQEVETAKRQGLADERLKALQQQITDLVERRSTLLTQLNPPAEKRTRFQKAVEAYLCAERLWKEGRSTKLIQGLLDNAVGKDVRVGPAFALRGQLALDRGRITAALSDSELAVQLAPQDSLGYFVRGRVKLERADTRGAMDDLAKAGELTRRKDGRVLHWLAAALFQAGRRADALSTQEEAFVLLPDDREVRRQLREFERQKPSTP